MGLKKVTKNLADLFFDTTALENISVTFLLHRKNGVRPNKAMKFFLFSDELPASINECAE